MGKLPSIAEDVGWKVKRINVNPGASLSLQKHKFRTEHWVVVSGTAKVELEGEIQILKKIKVLISLLVLNIDYQIQAKEKLILIEVQSEAYLGEDDIIRFEDNYGRKGTRKEKNLKFNFVIYKFYLKIFSLN